MSEEEKVEEKKESAINVLRKRIDDLEERVEKLEGELW